MFCAQLKSLQEKLHSTSLVYQSSSEENLKLQQTLQQQQTMLTESTTRVSELEESQSQALSQVRTASAALLSKRENPEIPQLLSLLCNGASNIKLP